MEDTQDIEYVIFVSWGIGACGVVDAVNEHRMNYFFIHSILKLSHFLKQTN